MQRRYVASAVCLVAMLGLVAAMCVIIWSKTSGGDSGPSSPEAFTSANLTTYAYVELRPTHVQLNFRAKTNTEGNNDRNIEQRVYLGKGLNNTYLEVFDSWSSHELLEFHWDDGTNMTFHSISSVHAPMSCMRVQWHMPDGSLETPEDCFDMTQSFWYGGFEEARQYWPLNRGMIPSTPFITGDGYQSNNTGDLIEGLFVSSAGVGIYVHDNSSLYISVNENNSSQLCLRGRTGPQTPYFRSHQHSVLLYDICHAADVAVLWKGMAQRYLATPTGMPSEDVLRYPIWSTWALYKGLVDQDKVIAFAENIRNHSFEISQLELDDNWTPRYGDFTFDQHKFPSPKEMIVRLTKMNIPLTVWMHPFFNNDSQAFSELDSLGYLVQTSDGGNYSALTQWWRGHHAGILDVTNPDAVQWYLKKLEDLVSDFNVTSFKFDAGEVNWLPGNYSVKNPITNPSHFSQLYAQMAYEADKRNRRQEVRTGFRSQELPILVRMIDRDSNWGYNKGLKTLIPCALTFGLMGYPFVLPDMVGGNAYDPSDLDRTVLPESELFIRWLQATSLMPSVQFSIPPWAYDDSTVTSISRKFINFHASFINKITSLARQAVAKGIPILRPVWWLAPNDQDALQTDSEFLLGDDVLVAPVLEKGAVTRDIYLPKGRWRYDSTGTYEEYSGPKWLRSFPVGLDVLPYFTRIHF